VTVNKQGRVTLPAGVRKELGIGDGSKLHVKVDDGAIRLRPATVIDEEDRWAYTREALASLKRGLADLKAGRIYAISAEDLLAGRFPVRLPGAPRRRRPAR